MMKPRVAVRDIALIAIASALLLVMQVALSFLPNIELISLLIILYTLHFKYKTLYIIYLFAIMEGVLYGFHTWWITYLYVWTILFFIVLIFREIRLPLFWAVLAAIYGLLFGALTSIPYFIIGGFGGGIAYIARGILFDLYHCAGNFAIVLALFKPLNHIFGRVISGAGVPQQAQAAQ